MLVSAGVSAPTLHRCARGRIQGDQTSKNQAHVAVKQPAYKQAKQVGEQTKQSTRKIQLLQTKQQLTKQAGLFVAGYPGAKLHRIMPAPRSWVGGVVPAGTTSAVRTGAHPLAAANQPRYAACAPIESQLPNQTSNNHNANKPSQTIKTATAC